MGAGAWGTTLARLVARTEPVTLLCHSPETAARIAATGRNEGAAARRGPAGRPPRHGGSGGHRRGEGPRHRGGPVGPCAFHDDGARRRPPAFGRRALRRQGPGTGNAAADERVGRDRFRLYVNADLLGVELAGVLKNVKRCLVDLLAREPTEELASQGVGRRSGC
ncbi:MAG: hypothetical protein WKF78_14325 [Candidatus Limnocylindrales bacterium]